MRVVTVFSGMLAIVLWSVVVALFAQQPQIDVTLANSTMMPCSATYFDMLPNGDLQFYNIAANNGSLQVTGFQYLSQVDSLTETVQIGNITGIPGGIQRKIILKRFGHVYAVYQFTGSEPQGFVIMRLDGNELIYRLIDNLQSGISTDIESRMDFVNENAAVIALDDSLVYYNILEGTSQTLLEEEVYQCDQSQEKRVYAMPDGHFAYIKDSREGLESAPETWYIYNSNGDYQFTQIMTDRWFYGSFIGQSYKQNYGLINGRFYIFTSGINFDNACLECYFPSPDTLSYYKFVSPGSVDESITGLIGFSNDRILRSYYDGDSALIYANYSPMELNPEPTHWGYLGSAVPCMNNLSDNVVTVLTRLEESIQISVFCTLDFPTIHSFTFPAPLFHATVSGYTFTHENKLFLISGGVIYTFHVDYTLPNADEAVSPRIPSLSVYPNPVNRRDEITFKASTKKPLEVDIYNIRGQKVKTVCLRSDGNTQWDLRNDKSESVSAGVYFAKPRQEQDSKPIKFIVLH